MSSNSPCAACKLLRRKCTPGCVFAPYFPPDNPGKFSCVHRVFGASNVAKILGDLSPTQREEAANSLAFEAEWRIRDPVMGCVGQVFMLDHRLRQVKDELDRARKELAALGGSISLGPAALGQLFHAPSLPLYHHHQYHHHLPSGASSSSAAVPHGMPRMGLGLAAPGGETHHGQMLIQQQPPPPPPLPLPQSADAQHAAMAAGMGSREQQEAMRIYEQQQELTRFSTGFSDGGRGYGGHHGGGGGVAMVAVATLPHSGLALVPTQSFDVPFMAQPLHYSEQQQHLQQQMQAQHQASESDDVRSGLSPSS